MFELNPTVWIVAGLVLAALEMLVPGLVIIWFGIAGVITGIVAFFIPNPYIQFGIFAVLSGLMVVFSQKIARRITHPEPEAVGANRMLGVTGIVVAAIDPPQVGRVKVIGDEWRATASCAIAVGTEVKVIAVDGTRLIVEPVEEGS